MCKLITCAKCCTIFSVTGFIFLIIIGVLLQKQPMYIRGPKDPAAAAMGCYEGAVIYLATFIISVLYWSFDEIRQGRFSSGRGQPQQPATQSKFGTTKYGAVVQT